MATTHVDLHGDKLSLQAFKDSLQQLNSEYLTMMVQHDPRLPPIGRLTGAKIVPLEDGEFALDATAEVWYDDPPLLPSESDTRVLALSVEECPLFKVSFDRSFSKPEDQVLINELARLSQTSPQEQMKKALEPISTLVIAAGLFAIGGVAAGFFNKLGEDLYNQLKSKLCSYFDRPDYSGLLIIEFGLQHPQRKVKAILIIETPTSDRVSDAFSRKFGDVDKWISSEMERVPNIAVIVGKWDAGNVEHLYVVSTSGIPTDISTSALHNLRKELIHIAQFNVSEPPDCRHN